MQIIQVYQSSQIMFFVIAPGKLNYNSSSNRIAPNGKRLESVKIVSLIAIAIFLIKIITPYWINRWFYTPGRTDLQALYYVILMQESHGEAQAVNHDSGALGYAQVMPENIPQWSEDALGYAITSEEFLASPQLQEQIVEYRLDIYWQEALIDSQGDEEKAVLMVASRWYSGDPMLYDSQSPQFYETQEYPSIASYSQRILQKWRLQRRPWRLLGSY